MAPLSNGDDPVKKAKAAAPATGAKPAPATKPAAAAKPETARDTKAAATRETKSVPAKSPAAGAARPAAKASSAPAPDAAAQRAAPVAQAKVAAQAQAAQAEEADEEEYYEEEGRSFVREMLRDSPAWLASAVVHMGVLLVMALYALPSTTERGSTNLSAISDQPAETLDELEEDIAAIPVETVTTEVDTSAQTSDVQFTDVVEAGPASSDVGPVAVEETVPIGFTRVDKGGVSSAKVGTGHSSGFSGRSKEGRANMVRRGGGNADSERAVAMALEWLAAHQMPDGGWSFDHRTGGACNGQCPNQGDLAHGARNVATAFAVLPFLAAGFSHKRMEKGKDDDLTKHYREVVHRGLYFLCKQMKPSQQGGSLVDGGQMYAHGICTICLCEAYGMTQDRELQPYAQQALNWIMTGQDKVSGGWGYGHGSGRDTSVSGWQVMALKSGHMAYLQVHPNTFRGVTVFLDGVQADSGASYGYTTPGRGPATTAVGLLCRMYQGWKNDHPAIERGMKTIATSGPGLGDWYRDYYANQVMFQATNGGQGDLWKAWNERLRTWLCTTQIQQGHMRGSWYGAGGHAGPGGRLYCTSLGCMMLEVYYRHMPIYKVESTQEEFPIE